MKDKARMAINLSLQDLGISNAEHFLRTKETTEDCTYLMGDTCILGGKCTLTTECICYKVSSGN